jgi:hypothetical protein
MLSWSRWWLPLEPIGVPGVGDWEERQWWADPDLTCLNSIYTFLLESIGVGGVSGVCTKKRPPQRLRYLAVAPWYVAVAPRYVAEAPRYVAEAPIYVAVAPKIRGCSSQICGCKSQICGFNSQIYGFSIKVLLTIKILGHIE